MCELCAATSTFDPTRHPGEGPLGENATVTETVDAPSTTATGYAINVGDTFSGSLTNGVDAYDVIAITLTAGTSYEMALSGFGSGAGTLPDPRFYLWNSSGIQVDEDDDGGPGLDSLLTFTATYTGTYYLVASSYGANDTGTYELTVNEVTPPPPPMVATLDELAGQLTDGYWNSSGRSGRRWDTSTDNVITVDLDGLTADGRQLARWAMEAWEAVANLEFQEVSGGADITFDDNQRGAFASSVVSGGIISSSTVNVSTSWLSSYGTTIGSYSFQTYIHEIGHALGLGHQGNYNGSAVYGRDETFSNDSWQVSIMSYFDQSDNTTVNASRAGLITTMMADIIAIQNLYGAPSSQAPAMTSGNTVWGSNSNLGGYLGQYFATLGGASDPNVSTSPLAFTIYDRGGTDTLDTTFSTTNDRISMWHSSFSDVNGLIGNIGIARGTIVENVTAGSGNDTILGNWADNLIQGNGGNDLIWASGGNDTVFGGVGNDEIGGFDGNDQLWGGAGNDSLYGEGGDDTLGGAGGHDVAWGGAGNDEIYGDDGNDTLGGQDGNDTIWAGANDDLIFGSVGHDVLGGGTGNDTVWGGTGADTIYGYDGDDHLHGADGWDEVWAGAGADNVTGGSGNDTLYGVSGNDTLNGGTGDDLLNGGSGADSFVFGAGFGADRVADFRENEGDRLRLDDALWIGTHGALSTSQVLSTFGTVSGGALTLNFGGGNVLTLSGISSTSGLSNDIDIF